MKTVVMIGAGQMGRAAAALASDQALHILAFGDNEATGQIYGIPVLPVAEALRLQAIDDFWRRLGQALRRPARLQLPREA